MSVIDETHFSQPTGRLSKLRIWMCDWRPALGYGVKVALFHRAVLTVWTSLVWVVVQPYIPFPPCIDAHTNSDLPVLASPILSTTLGVWRRWDAVHYLTLSTSGYSVDNPGSTVFGVLTPASFAIADRILPGPVDLAASVVETLAFAAALVLLYRLVEVEYGGQQLARMAVLVTALIPTSYFFAAPMSESLFLASVLFFFYSAFRGRWGLAAVGGILATLARSQGAALAGIGAVIVLERVWRRQDSLATNFRRTTVAGWPLALIPLGYALFLGYRQVVGLPPLFEVYRNESFAFFTDPLSGFYWTLRHLFSHPRLLLTEADFQAIPVCIALGVLMLRDPHRWRLSIILYTWGYFMVFFTQVNWLRNTEEIAYSQSVARYTLMLFPLAIVFADRVLLRLRPASRDWVLIGMLTLLLVTSARHVLYLAGP